LPVSSELERSRGGMFGGLLQYRAMFMRYSGVSGRGGHGGCRERQGGL
jgi:hypothetical protein